MQLARSAPCFGYLNICASTPKKKAGQSLFSVHEKIIKYKICIMVYRSILF